MFRGARSKKDSPAAGASPEKAAAARPAVNPHDFARVMRGYYPQDVDKYLTSLDTEAARLLDADSRRELAVSSGASAAAVQNAPEDEVPRFPAVMRGYDMHQVDQHIKQKAAEIRGLRTRLRDRDGSF